jgi:hypothetical protein
MDVAKDDATRAALTAAPSAAPDVSADADAPEPKASAVRPPAERHAAC